MNSLNNQKQELAKYTKEELIAAIKSVDYKGNILKVLPLVKYQIMTEKANFLGSKASEYLNNNEPVNASEYFDKSNKLYEEANDFLNRNRNDQRRI